MKKIIYGGVLLLAGLWVACTPQIDDKIDLPTPPTASFEVQTTANPNRVRLVNTTPGAFLFGWDLGNGSKADSSVVEAYYPFKGTYTVSLRAFNAGGFGTATKQVVIAQDDPAGCSGNLALLTGCSSKTWVLSPTAGAFRVGPDPNFNTVWYANTQADVAARACQFNDEYIFSKNGTFQYNNKGDFWADTDGNGNITPADLGVSPGCQAATAWPARYAAWNSGTHQFSLSPNELRVVGNGAFICLYKVATGAEVTTPQASVTYQVKELTANKLVLLVSFGPGYWEYTLVPK